MKLTDVLTAAFASALASLSEKGRADPRLRRDAALRARARVRRIYGNTLPHSDPLFHVRTPDRKHYWYKAHEAELANTLFLAKGGVFESINGFGQVIYRQRLNASSVQ